MWKMKKQYAFLRRIISFKEYPRYITDLYLKLIWSKIWKERGIIFGKGINWLGKPIMSIHKESKIIIGDSCIICSRSSQTALGVNHPVIIRTLRGNAILHIGSNVRMSGTTICAAKQIVIGNRCVIGSNVTIADTDFHSLDPLIRSSLDDASMASFKPVIIGEDVFIGGGTTILKGVNIGKGAVIGAGSVITSDIPPNSVAAGNPAKVIKYLTRSL